MLSRLFHVDPLNQDWINRDGQSSSLSFLFDAKNISGYEKTLLYGPELSGKTSLLFELAMSFADEGKHVLFVCGKKISKLPLLAQGRTQPTSKTLNYVQIVYLDTREEYLNYMASVHFLTSLKFNAVIVDGIDAYFPATIKKEDLSIVARVIALTVDAFLFQKSKQMSEASSMLLMSMSVACGMKSLPRQAFYERWIQCFLSIQEKESELFQLSLIPANVKDSCSVANVLYRIRDQSFIVEDVEYSTQSDCGSSER